MIPGDHGNADPGRAAGREGVGHVGSWWVVQPHQPEQAQVTLRLGRARGGRVPHRTSRDGEHPKALGGQIGDRLLGPAEALMGLAAFGATFLAAGWRPGQPFPTGSTLAAASGATFLTVVLAQAANAFACRSSTRTPAALGWLTNRLLPPSVGVALVFCVLSLLVPPVARALGQQWPTPVGLLFAVASIGVLLGVDAADKRLRARRGARSSPERQMPIT